MQRGHCIAHTVDAHNAASLATLDPKTVDVAMEFSEPVAAYGNIRQCIAKNIPTISGTTGWLSQKEALDAYCEAHRGTFFYASNFSVGMHIFHKVSAFLAKIIGRHDVYDVHLQEEHHQDKKDMPSGTALILAEDIMRHMPRKKCWEIMPKKLRDSLGIQVNRRQDVPGTHTVTYDSPLDTLQIQHKAHSREGFAWGAVLVAEWVRGKQGVLGMEDFMQLDDY